MRRKRYNVMFGQGGTKTDKTEINGLNYVIDVLERLNRGTDVQEVLRNTLEDLCAFFGFGMGITYEQDHNKNLMRTSVQGKYSTETPEVITPDFFSEQELDYIRNEKSIAFRSDTPNTPLIEKLKKHFSAQSMIFVPTFDKKNVLIAFCCLLDRRGKARQTEHDMKFTIQILMTFSVYIEMQMYQRMVETTHKALDSILNHMGIDVYVNDFDTHEMFYLNKSMAAPYGNPEEIIGMKCYEALYDDKHEECDFCPKKHLIDENGNPTKVYGWDYQRPFDGAWFRVLSAAFPWTDGRMAQVISSVDITENKRNEELVRRMAQYDTLTGLLNRSRLTNDLDALGERIKRTNQQAYLIFFDLDGFKKINDEQGHGMGDALLTEVGKFLQSGPIPKNDSYRYGGDEFVILTMLDNNEDCKEYLQYLIDGFTKPWVVNGKSVDFGASLGVARCPVDTESTGELLRLADQAMYRSKKKGTCLVHGYRDGKLAQINIKPKK